MIDNQLVNKMVFLRHYNPQYNIYNNARKRSTKNAYEQI